ncbi:MAG TPA: C-type lectin domain-containing protein [Polyangiaceae bacterium]|nr:C-type lectin domain-containing protein [Polyangiaceae bacterium]
MTGAQSHKLLMWALLSSLLWHCSLDSDGLGPNGSTAGTGGGGPAGAMGATGAAGAANGTGGAGGAGAGGGGEGGAGGGGGAGAGGSAGGGGGAGTGGAPGGMGGTGGVAGQGGAGGAPVDCDAGRDEFGVPGEPGSCFFLMHATSKARPPSDRTTWTQSQADADCKAFDGARLGGPDTLTAYGQVTGALSTGTYGVVTSDVWLGAATALAPEKVTQAELAPSFRWLNDDPWNYATPSTPPWGGGEPRPVGGAACVRMRAGAFGLGMTNTRCDQATGFVLCERKPPPPRAGPGGGRQPRR